MSTNKIDLVRAYIEKLHKEHRGSEGDSIFRRALRTVLFYIDSLPEEPVSEELEKAIDTYLKSYWGDEKEKQEWPFLKKMAIYFAEWQKEKDESTTEDLGEYINELSKQFPEVSFAKLSRIAVRVAKWQKEQMMANTTDAIIGLPYENKDGGYTHLIDVSRPLPVGNNKIAIIFKED